MADKIIKSSNYYILKDDVFDLEAVLGNIRSITNEKGNLRLQVLFRNIVYKDEELMKNQWVNVSKNTIKLAQQNMNKKIKFQAHCLQYATKDGDKLKLDCYIDKVKDVELIG